MNAALSFYQLLTTVSFTLLGLWFVVMGLDPRWRHDPVRHRASLHTTLMFFLPGAMGLGSVLSGGDALFWRVFFVAGGLAGLVEALAYLRSPADGDRVVRHLAPLAYIAVVAAAVLPGPVLGLVPLQVEGLATGLVFVGGMARLWLGLTRTAEPAARPGPVTPVGRPR